ncbi:MAG: hypothetical protein LBP79_05320 [Clostridiales bacterium]|jgi:hypothetical protein|nr:hypothetical protein [Clostridiales bacterium]
MNTLIVLLLMAASGQAPASVTAANISAYLNGRAAAERAVSANETDGRTASAAFGVSEYGYGKERSFDGEAAFRLKPVTVRIYYRDEKLSDYSFSCLHQK